MSELARKLIAENVAKRERGEEASYLDLGRCGLTELPDLSHMYWLETLIASNEWWDGEQRKWISSQNTGPKNKIAQPSARFLPDGLRKVVIGGIWGEIWPINDGRFLENLTGLISLDLSSNKISDWHFLENLTRLTSLDLKNNRISNGRFLENLTGLTSLDLRNNQISDGRFLENLTGLTSLGLTWNQINDGHFLKKMTELTSLDLGNNQISDGYFLENLTGLTSLSLWKNEISDWHFLKNLTGLTSLDLRYNQISNVRFLENLTGLISLDLSDNHISNGSFLGNLMELTSLNLTWNQISDGSFLKNLTGLTSLGLKNNQISDWRFLENLTGLTSLDLMNERISDGDFLKSLTRLISLNLMNNQISDGSFLGQMTGLTSLDLNYNQISDIRFLENLTELTSLNLGNNQISDVRFLGKLTGLTSLNLGNNQINDGCFLENLTELISLDLTHNQISDVRFLENLTGLTKIDLSNNKLQDLTPFLYFMQKKGMQVVLKEWYKTQEGEINLEDNPLTTPPIEIVQQGNEAILEYFERLKAGSEQVREAKMLILGEGGAGKTSLLRRLKGQPMPGEAESTHGIDVQSYTFKAADGRDFKVSIWDFGGQEIYHATHQFFLTKRSLYVLVADVRKEDTDFQYWLQMVELLAGDSPVLVLQNEKGGRKKALNEQGLRARFGRNIRLFEAFDLKEDDIGLERLRREIEHHIQQLPHVQEVVPADWAALRREIEAKKEKGTPYLTDRDYYALCESYGLVGTQADTLAQYLHDLGVFLHFQDDPILKRWVFLSNTWVTDGVYAVLDDPTVFQQKGQFDRTVAAKIWAGRRYESMYDELLQLMLRFELAYRIPDQKDLYLAPQMLGVEEPPLPPADPQQLQLRYEYDFMPKGLLSRLIVRLHRYIRDVESEAWRSGVVLYRQGARAELREVYGTGRLELRVGGTNAKELLTIVAEEIDRLNDSFTNLRVRKLVPCICSECRRSGTPYFHTYEKLMRARERGRTTVECALSFEDAPVLNLIDNIFLTTFFLPRPLEVFFSYSKADQIHLDTLLNHLSPLNRDGSLLTWHDRDLLPGEEWGKRIRQQLTKADVIVLLVSADYLATDYVWTELDIALKRHNRVEAVVVPVIVRPCLWKDAPFARLNALPNKGKPITQWDNQDEAWAEVAVQIQKLTKRLRK